MSVGHAWKRRTHFAELAEAVGCNTDDVLAAYQREDHSVVVLFTTGTDDLATARCWRITLTPMEDGLYRTHDREELDTEWLKDVLR